MTFDKVKECMGVVGDIPVHIEYTKDSFVMCNGHKAKGCYENGNILVPYKGGYNIFYHEFVHAICDKVKGLGNDPLHECTAQDGSNAYLKCGGGLMVE
jgi:hypothetical protein